MTRVILSLTISLAVGAAVKAVLSIRRPIGEKMAVYRLGVFTTSPQAVTAQRPRTTLSQLIGPARILSTQIPVSNIIERLKRSRKSQKYFHNLQASGLDDQLSVDDLYAIKILLALILFLFSLNTFIHSGMAGLLMLLGLSFAGYQLPDFFLSGTVDERQTKIRKLLPDAVDLLIVGMEAGLGFDRAMRLYCERFQGPLSEEFKKTIAEIDLGQTRREALSSLAARNQLEDLRLFVGSILQAEKLGTPLAGVLVIQSDMARTRHRQWIQELSAKAPVKILFPLAGLILPALFAVLIGPIIIKMISG